MFKDLNTEESCVNSILLNPHYEVSSLEGITVFPRGGKVKIIITRRIEREIVSADRDVLVPSPLFAAEVHYTESGGRMTADDDEVYWSQQRKDALLFIVDARDRKYGPEVVGMDFIHPQYAGYDHELVEARLRAWADSHADELYNYSGTHLEFPMVAEEDEE